MIIWKGYGFKKNSIISLISLFMWKCKFQNSKHLLTEVIFKNYMINDNLWWVSKLITTSLYCVLCFYGIKTAVIPLEYFFQFNIILIQKHYWLCTKNNKTWKLLFKYIFFCFLVISKMKLTLQIKRYDLDNLANSSYLNVVIFVFLIVFTYQTLMRIDYYFIILTIVKINYWKWLMIKIIYFQ